MNELLAICFVVVLIAFRAATSQSVNIQSSGSSRVVVKNGRVRATGDVVVGNGVTMQHTFSCKSFHTIVSDQSIDIIWGYGEVPGVVIEGDENIISSMSVVVSGGTLKIQGVKSYVSQGPLRAYATSPAIRQAKLSGSGDVEVVGCNGDEFIVDAQGSGDITIGGRVKRLTLRLSGSGDVDAIGCDAGSVRVNMSGSGDVSVSSNGVVSGSMTGAGDLTISGNAVINVRNDGAGEIYSD